MLQSIRQIYRRHRNIPAARHCLYDNLNIQCITHNVRSKYVSGCFFLFSVSVVSHCRFKQVSAVGLHSPLPSRIDLLTVVIGCVRVRVSVWHANYQFSYISVSEYISPCIRARERARYRLSMDVDRSSGPRTSMLHARHVYSALSALFSVSHPIAAASRYLDE